MIQLSFVTVSNKVSPPTVNVAGGQWWRWEVAGSVFFSGNNQGLPSSQLPSCHFHCIQADFKDQTHLYSVSEDDQCTDSTSLILVIDACLVINIKS